MSELAVFVDRSPDIEPHGPNVHVIDRSGGRTLRRVMTRHDFEIYVDRSVRLLTGRPDPEKVVRLDDRARARLARRAAAAPALGELPDDIALFVEAPELFEIEGVVHIVNLTGGRTLRRVMSRASLHLYAKNGLALLGRPEAEVTPLAS